MVTKKLQVNVDFTKYPELYKTLMGLVEDQSSTPPRIIRKLVSDGLEIQAHVDGLRAKVKEKIKKLPR